MVLSVANLSNRPVPFGGIYTPLNRSALVGLIRVMAVRNGGTGQSGRQVFLMFLQINPQRTSFLALSARLGNLKIRYIWD